MNGRVLVAVLAGVLGCGLLAGCGGSAPSGSAAPSSASSGGTLTVSAASSLTDVFNGLGKQFEAQNPGSTVRFNYGGSSSLAQQIVSGAPVDVFASASPSTMDTVAKAGLTAAAPKVFTSNTLRIAVPPGDPKNIHTLTDLTRPDLKVVLCAPQVPCGMAATAVQKATGVTLKPVSQEPDVRSALTKVTSGDADAALVYVTDVKSAGGKVDGVDFPEAAKAVNQYPIAVLKGTKQPELAARWVALVEGAEGRKALSDAGFATP